VLERYAIVGIVEDFENTMKSFEVVAPHFFAGASELLNDEEEAKKRKRLYFFTFNKIYLFLAQKLRTKMSQVTQLWNI
jgi:hypothetical protein